MITQTGSIQTVPLEQTAPPVLERDPKIAALVKALAAILQENAKLLYAAVGFYYRVGELEETALDILAGDLHADWYDYDGSLDEKRRLIANDVQIHRTMGTIATLRRVLTAIHSGCSVEEWFEYEGEPYFFRVTVDMQSPEDMRLSERTFSAINTYKPVRARLENLCFRRTEEQGLHVGIAAASAITRRVECRVPAGMEVVFMTDEDDNILMDENGNRYIDEEV